MLNSIIKTFLDKNTRLVIPNFGAFIKKEGGEVIFTQLFKKDDGVLADLVARQYAVDLNSAYDIIAKFVLQLKKQVLSSGAYLISELGEFELLDNGQFSFIHTEADFVMPKPEKEIELVPVIAELVEIQKEFQQNNAEIKDPELEAEPEPVKEPVKEQEPEPEQTQEQPVKEVVKPKEQEKKSGKDMVMIIAIIVTILAVLAMVYGLVFSDTDDFGLTPQTYIEQTE